MGAVKSVTTHSMSWRFSCVIVVEQDDSFVRTSPASSAYLIPRTKQQGSHANQIDIEFLNTITYFRSSSLPEQNNINL